MLSSTAEREPDESLALMSFKSPTRSNISIDKPLCNPGNLPISRALRGNNKALIEKLGMEKSFQKVNGEFRIGIRPNEKCTTYWPELKSPYSVTERNVKRLCN